MSDLFDGLFDEPGNPSKKPTTAEELIRTMLTPYRVEWDNQEAYLADLERTKTQHMDEADVVSSELHGFPNGVSMHAIALDIDYPVFVVPSSTEGHWHLYIHKPGGIPHQGYMALVALLGHLGVIEPGYATASLRRGHTDLRPPWVRKGKEPGKHDLPAIGSRWHWEPDKEQAAEHDVVVLRVEDRSKADDPNPDWWIQSRGPSGTYWNDLNRWEDSAVPMKTQEPF